MKTRQRLFRALVVVARSIFIIGVLYYSVNGGVGGGEGGKFLNRMVAPVCPCSKNVPLYTMVLYRRSITDLPKLPAVEASGDPPPWLLNAP